ncbi:Hypothetical protein FKW44_015322, partial [Caligus rogercresseyi]
GNPLCPFALDPLLTEINLCQQIKSVTFGETELKIEAFEDDVTVMYTGSEEEIDSSFIKQ